MASSLSALAHSRARCALNGYAQRLRFSQWSNVAGDGVAAMANGTSILLAPVIAAVIASARCAAAPPAAPADYHGVADMYRLIEMSACRALQALPFERTRVARLRAFCFFCATVDGAAQRVHHVVSSSGRLKRSAAAGVYLSCVWQVDGASPTQPRARRQPLSGMCCCRVTRAFLSMSMCMYCVVYRGHVRPSVTKVERRATRDAPD